MRDIQGRISQIGLARPGQARQIVVNNVTYAAFGPATGWIYGNGRQLQRPLDLDYRPQAVHDPAAGGLSLGYGYDPVGSVTELKNGTGSTVLAKVRLRHAGSPDPDSGRRDRHADRNLCLRRHGQSDRADHLGRHRQLHLSRNQPPADRRGWRSAHPGRGGQHRQHRQQDVHLQRCKPHERGEAG